VNSFVGDVGYLLTSVLFGLLFFYQLKKETRSGEGYVASIAWLLTAVWGGLALISAHQLPTNQQQDMYLLTQAADIAKSVAMYLMLFSFLGLFKDPKALIQKSRGMSILLALVLVSMVPVVALVLSYLGMFPVSNASLEILPSLPYKKNDYLTWLLLLSIVGLVLLEQILRNAKLNHQWHLKYLGIGLGASFCYDTYMYTEAILVPGVGRGLWSFRGYLYAVSAIFVGITLIRTRSESIKLHFSRKIVFHSSMMLSAGVYLLLMSAAGFLLKKYSSYWGEIQQAFFWGAASISLLVLVSSGKYRSYLRYYVTRNLFSTKYDYRDEWMRISRTLGLSNVDNSLQERAVIALADCVDSAGGSIWLSRDGTIYEQVAQVDFGWVEEANVSDDSNFIHFLQSKQWIVDLTDGQKIHEDVEYPAWLKQLKKIWLIIPLSVDESLLGFVLLKNSRGPRNLNWEDLDLLKAAAKQASSYLGLAQATEALSEARQFSAFNQMSAFVVHDLKTLNSQLSLMVANAPKYKTNPSFVDDMIETSAHVVGKLNTLLSHLKNTNTNTQSSGEKVELLKLVHDVVAIKKHAKVQLEIIADAEVRYVYAKGEELKAALGHLIQNAIDASAEDAKVEISLETKGEYALVIVQDYGVGMSEDFVRAKLFRPFESTKGLTGMGIGAFQSREFIRRLGGDITVQSEVGVGSRFQVSIPLMG
jgi:putative PEP-CTERM system histidine kinase